MGLGLVGVASAMSVVFFFYFFGLSAFTCGHFMTPAGCLRHNGIILVCFLYYGVSAILSEWLGALTGSGTLGSFVSLSSFLALCFPVLLLANKHIHFFATLCKSGSNDEKVIGRV